MTNLTNYQVLSGIQGAGGTIDPSRSIDTRTPLEKLRRLGLYRLLKENGHDISENMEYTKMLHFAKAYEDQLDWRKVEVRDDGFGGYIVRKPQSHIDEEREFDKKYQALKTELESLKRPKLMDKAKELSVPHNISMKNDEIIEAILTAVNV
jgi:hypothetical protein